MTPSEVTGQPLPEVLRDALWENSRIIQQAMAQLAEAQRKRAMWFSLIESMYGTREVDEVTGVVFPQTSQGKTGE